jgi:hypothetical protein
MDKPETNKVEAPLTPINEGTTDKKMADIKLALAFAIVWGIGIATGYYLTMSGFL